MITNIDKTGEKEFLKVAPFRSHIRKTKPHKHNSYYEIVFLKEGSGIHSIDGIDYLIKPPMVFGIRQDQIHFLDIDLQPEGFVLIIKKEFITQNKDNRIKQLIATLSEYNCIEMKEDNLSIIFEILCTEINQNKTVNIDSVDGLVKVILSNSLGQKLNSHSINPISNSLFLKYKDCLINERPLSNKVQFYANKLNTTPQNLNNLCRNEVSKSAGEFLSEFIIGEAKRLLVYSDFSINEICYSLGFKDNSHFSKYFKKKVGQSPSGFRNNIE